MSEEKTRMTKSKMTNAQDPNDQSNPNDSMTQGGLFHWDWAFEIWTFIGHWCFVIDEGRGVNAKAQIPMNNEFPMTQ